ncbi:MAG TPA: hypothetical protein VGG72_08115 [Bryobacteraceae bacterium]|jgi:hypothetical protein
MKRFAILGLLMAGVAAGQGQSAADLIKFLTTPRPVDDPNSAFVITCGVTESEMEANRKDREAAETLMRLGSAAVPDLERAMDSMGPNNSWLLLHVYARIQGPAGLPRLRAMAEGPNFAPLQYALADSLALSLGLTGYVAGSGDYPGTRTCGFLAQRDPLNQFILAWERNDPLQASLGPMAQSALDSLLQGRSWQDMRADLWRGKSGSGVAVGYHFDVDGLRSPPEETLGDTQYSEGNRLNFDSDVMTFTSASGADCGKYRLRFSSAGIDGYKIDNSDLEGLLRLIAACAAAK